MTISDRLKQKIDDLEIERRVADAIAEGERTVVEAVEKAGSLAHERRTDIEGWLDKAADSVNGRTQGRYADKVDAVRDQIVSGVDKLAEKRSDPPAG
ncbi:antitoxin [Nocardioides sp. LHG3406-4]|uniref:antitoxin n=1 Tax=Nocardioides sp. LHG3406-4 TaxID=2804575 RepID=UPI003CFAAA62